MQLKELQCMVNKNYFSCLSDIKSSIRLSNYDYQIPCSMACGKDVEYLGYETMLSYKIQSKKNQKIT